MSDPATSTLQQVFRGQTARPTATPGVYELFPSGRILTGVRLLPKSEKEGPACQS